MSLLRKTLMASFLFFHSISHNAWVFASTAQEDLVSQKGSKRLRPIENYFLPQKRKPNPSNVSCDKENTPNNENSIILPLQKSGDSDDEMTPIKGIGGKKKCSMNLYLLSSSITQPEDALKDILNDESWENKTFTQGIGISYSRKKQVIPPAWNDLFEEQTEPNGNKTGDWVRDAGIIIFKDDDLNRFFAYTFGQGYRFIRKSAQEPNFGIRTALNIMDVDKENVVKSFGIQTFALNSCSQLTAYARGTGLRRLQQEFEHIFTTIAPNRNALGFPMKIRGVGTRISFNAEADITKIKKSAQDIYSIYQKEDYKKHFSWIDQYIPEGDEEKIKELERGVCATLSNRHKKDEWFFDDPRDIDQSILGYTYKGESFDDLDKLKEGFCEKAAFVQHSIEKFKKEKIILRYEGDETKISLYKLLRCGVDLGDETFFLDGGKWYRISQNHIESLNAFLNERFDPNDSLGPVKEEDFQKSVAKSSSAGKSRIDLEGNYNERSAKESKGNIALFDKLLIKGDTSRDPYHLNNQIEGCDLFRFSEREIIHVKDWSGSSTFSHLCAQAHVSAKCLEDSYFRERMVETYTKKNGKSQNQISQLQNLFLEDFQKESFTVVLAFFHENNRENLSDYLPIFSRINLKRTIDNIERLGYKVKILKIKKPKQPGKTVLMQKNIESLLTNRHEI